MAYIDTEEFSAQLRSKAIDIERKTILITNFSGSQQQKDFADPPNCAGFGRIRHFKMGTGEHWPTNPLPILPAAKALGIRPEAEMRTQVFQSSICNWRCWYCFVDFDLLKGDTRYASHLTCGEMLDLYLNQESSPSVIDLTGGQPDLTPEWIPWMMEALVARGLHTKVYLWSDDNLSNDYLWRFLSTDQLSQMTSYQMYSRVCCFKGIDEDSFSLNTKADPRLFQYHLGLCRRLLDLGLDLYCYVTLTSKSTTDFESAIPRFLDQVQTINEMLPLRIVPLQVKQYTPVDSRINDTFSDMIQGQHIALLHWQNELSRRFSVNQLMQPITEVNIRK